jgi:membrane-bound lytic murein transglycosylase MltF
MTDVVLRPSSRGYGRIAAALCAVLVLVACGCSREKAAPPAQAGGETAQTAPAGGQTAAPPTAPPAQPPMDERLPAALRTPWKGDLDEIVKRRVVRVMLPFRRPEFFYMDGQPAGILQQAFEELERVLNAKYKTTAANRILVALLPTRYDQLRERMLGGYADIAAYGISITETNKKVVDFTVPTLTGLKMVLVTGPGAPELKTIEDLSGKEIWITPQTRMKGDIDALNARLKSQGKAPAIPRDTDRMLEPGDVMEMVNVGTYPVALMQSQTAEFWAQVFDAAKVRMDLAVADDVQLGWAIQKGTPKLKAFLDEFIATHGVGTSFGNTLIRRYLKEAKYIRNAQDASELRKFKETAPVFKKYANEYGLDALLLVAQGYQESRLDQDAKSHVGAIGIMQVMPKTAASPPVNVPNIHTADANVRAGVRLVHYLINDYFNEKELDPINRTIFAIAAYNAGPSKIARCRQLAKEMGYDPNKWFGNVEVATAKLVGRETTQYVANIYKYYIAYQMAADIRDARAASKKR